MSAYTGADSEGLTSLPKMIKKVIMVKLGAGKPRPPYSAVLDLLGILRRCSFP